MKTLYLHIGLPKTGTTSLQNFLHINRELLKEYGVLYPKSGIQGTAHHSYANIFSDTNIDWIIPVDQKLALINLKEECDRSDCNIIIISSEALSYTNVNAKKAKDFFSNFNIKILLTLRRQDEFIESALRDNIKTGHYVSFDYKSFIQQSINFLSYLNIINKWESVFGSGNISLSVFEPNLGIASSIEEEFLLSVGVKIPINAVIPERLNDRLSLDALEFLRIGHQGRRFSNMHFRIFNALANYSKKNPDNISNKYIIPPSDRHGIMEKLSDENSEIAHKYLGRESLFSLGNDNDSFWMPYQGLTVENSAKIGMFLAQYIFTNRMHY